MIEYYHKISAFPFQLYFGALILAIFGILLSTLVYHSSQRRHLPLAIRPGEDYIVCCAVNQKLNLNS